MNKIFGFLYFTAARCQVLEIIEYGGKDKATAEKKLNEGNI